MKHNMKLALVAFTALTALSYEALAATQSVTANISFDTPITLTKNADISFGTVTAGVADTYTITTAAVVTAAGAGQWLGGTKTAGDITIAGSTTQTVNISAGSYTANNGVTPQNAKCAYNGGAEVACSIVGAAAPGAGKTLKLGTEAVVNGTQAAGSSAAPTFVVTVVYP